MAGTWKQLLYTVMILAAVVIMGVCVFLKYYSSYIDTTLYAERLNQMQDVSVQLFSGLEDALENHWAVAKTQSNFLLQERPGTAKELYDLMKRQCDANLTERSKPDFIAVDTNGTYYTKNGMRGSLDGIDYITDEPKRVSYVHTSEITGIKRMVMLERLSEPLIFDADGSPAELIYYGMFCEMSDLEPYLVCESYKGNNSVYILDDTGKRLFNDPGVDLLSGDDLYSVLSRMEYLHGGSFDRAMTDFKENGSAYLNASLDGKEYYYSLCHLENSRWTLLFIVPSDFVATNTVALVDKTVEMVLIFAVILVCICAAIIYTIMYIAQRHAISVEHRNNTKLARLNRDLETANKAKSEFLSNMSHDIRTPMNAIIGIADIMEYASDDPEKIKDHVHKIQNSGKHLMSLINDVLDMSKIEAGEVVLNTEPVSLSEQIEITDEIIRPRAEMYGHKFNVNMNGIKHDRVIADSLRLRQILINLLSNAVKYTPAGGTVDITLAELPDAPPGSAVFKIVVSDTGCGMTKEFASHVFEPFVRAEDHAAGRQQGTGLGLAITKKLVDLMNGTISVESEPGKGSRFEVILTFPIAAAQDRMASENGACSGRSSLYGMKILYAEDNALNAEILKEILKTRGAECTVYPDGEALVKAFADVRPGDYDAILMDMHMPKLNGLEATRAIRNGANPLGKSIPIIAMTANAFSEDVSACLDAGMNSHLSKPIDIDLLERTVGRLVAESRKSDEE